MEHVHVIIGLPAYEEVGPGVHQQPDGRHGNPYDHQYTYVGEGDGSCRLLPQQRKAVATVVEEKGR